LNQLHNHHIKDTTFLSTQETETRRKTQSHAHKPTNTYYINIRQGRTPENYTGRRATHNHYTQIKTYENIL
jgi:hypothetical protein